ncbi:MAG: FAD-binding oxidoreductase [Granulosicoccus sp.]
MKLLYANDAKGEHADSWYHATCQTPARSPLESHLDVDVCVVGAGYTGLSTALHLTQANRSVVVLDAHRIGWGASGRNGGQLGSGFNQSQAELERSLGNERAHALWTLAEEAKKTVHDMCATYDIDIEYQPGIIHADHRARFVADTHVDCEKLINDYAYDAIETLSRKELRSLVDSPHYFGGSLDRGAGHLHPLKLAAGLAVAAETEGAQLFEMSEVIRIVHATDTTHDKPLRVVTPGGSVRAERVVIACNGYLDTLEPRVARHVMPINNYIVATEPLGDLARELIADNHAVADSRFVVNYFRRSGDDRLLFGGGESYGYQFPSDITNLVRKPLLQVFPQLANVSIDYAWGGTLAITRSRLPCVQQLSHRVYSAAGYSGHGVALAIMSGRAISEALNGDTSRFELLQNLPTAQFPGPSALRPALLALAMSGYSLLDRL